MLILKYLDRYVGIPFCYGIHLVDLLLQLFRKNKKQIRIRRILLIKFWGIGNLVMILPLLEPIRRRYPESNIYFLTLRRNREFLEDHPQLHGILTIQDRPIWMAFFNIFKVIWEMRQLSVDLTLDFEQFSRTSALLAYLGGGKQRIGLDTPGQMREVLYNARVHYSEERHTAELFADVARAAGAVITPESFRLNPGEEEKRSVERLLQSIPSGPLFNFHIGSGDNFPGKRWDAENFAKVADFCIDRLGALILFTGSLEEQPLIQRCLKAMKHVQRARDLSAKLRPKELIALIARCDLLLSNDTAPVHIGSALGIPVIALYGPTSPKLYGPRGVSHVVFYKNLPCSPCLTNFNTKTSSCRMPECMAAIQIEEVESAILKIHESSRLPKRTMRTSDLLVYPRSPI